MLLLLLSVALPALKTKHETSRKNKNKKIVEDLCVVYACGKITINNKANKKKKNKGKKLKQQKSAEWEKFE